MNLHDTYTYENMMTDILQRADGRHFRLESFGTDGDFKVYMPRRKEPPIEKTVLFIGTGRSGTMYISDLCKANGFDVGHELVGRDGVASHFFAYDNDWHPLVLGQPLGHIHVGEHRSDYTFKHIVHVVRHPLDCIASIQHFFHDSDYEFLKCQNLIGLKRGDLRSAIRIYINVNRRCELQSTYPPIHIENFSAEFAPLAEKIFGRPFECGLNEKSNTSTHERLTWKQLFSEDHPNVAEWVYDMACQYGYETRE